MKNTLKGLYLVAGVLTILEYVFISGMFTWMIAAGAILLLGALNILSELREKKYMDAMLYGLCTIAMVMGYFKLL